MANAAWAVAALPMVAVLMCDTNNARCSNCCTISAAKSPSPRHVAAVVLKNTATSACSVMFKKRDAPTGRKRRSSGPCTRATARVTPRHSVTPRPCCNTGASAPCAQNMLGVAHKAATT